LYKRTDTSYSVVIGSFNKIRNTSHRNSEKASSSSRWPKHFLNFQRTTYAKLAQTLNYFVSPNSNKKCTYNMQPLLNTISKTIPYVVYQKQTSLFSEVKLSTKRKNAALHLISMWQYLVIFHYVINFRTVVANIIEYARLMLRQYL